jgi:putative heme-binding domain-containing protein
MHWTGVEKATGQTSAAWLEWFNKNHPREAASLPGLASADFRTWKKRLDGIAWESGDSRRGEVVFQRKNCYRCHGDARRLGPDLVGVGQRFSRDDLFTAIIDPNKDIAPAYRGTAIVTNSGKVHTGVVIYESPALYLLQTTPDTTVRVPREELQLVQPSEVSFMPSGLIDDLNDAELADLYAFLKGLRKQ